MSPGLSTARHRRTAVARAVAVLALVAAVALLVVGSSHAMGADARAMAAGHATHLVADDVLPTDGCVGCVSHDEGVMAACVMMLVIVAMVSSLRGAPSSWSLRVPASPRQSEPPVVTRPVTPRLEALGICRT